jgi:hypothetical protein
MPGRDGARIVAVVSQCRHARAAGGDRRGRDGDGLEDEWFAAHRETRRGRGRAGGDVRAECGAQRPVPQPECRYHRQQQRHRAALALDLVGELAAGLAAAKVPAQLTAQKLMPTGARELSADLQAVDFPGSAVRHQ